MSTQGFCENVEEKASLLGHMFFLGRGYIPFLPTPKYEPDESIFVNDELFWIKEENRITQTSMSDSMNLCHL